ncbi:hypothetical protein LTR05_005718 [Lithohypha guttulata]|uniref:NmrA-like domain-containing protein n=1 Tax=Lithohypha guttulata TaxID=1690604 RepID=A0AAN7SYK5_9EURO|nr:hypothetical protein LTR05_005718 [Lithohypha guttulata]
MQASKLIKVAIAGTGNVSQYLVEELVSYGHEVVVLSRRSNTQEKRCESRQTDYSVNSLLTVLEDCDALVSTVADYQNLDIPLQIHLTMLEACKQSRRCKTFVPSEWTSNVEDYPEQPMFFANANEALHQKLKESTDIRSTIVCNSWFADYIYPAQQRYLPDIGAPWPMDHASKTFTIYGPGTQLIDIVSVRDVAKAVAVLLATTEPWDPYTYLSGQQLSWNDLFTIISKRDPEWTSRTKPLADTINQIVANESPDSVLTAQFEVLSYSGASMFPKDKVQRHRAKYFPNLRFRNVEELLDAAAAARPGAIV